MEKNYNRVSFPGNFADRQRNFFEKRYEDGNYLSIPFIASCRMHHEAVLSLLNCCDLEPKIIIDIGCACGDFTNILKSKFGQSKVFGVDFIEKGLLVGKNRYEDVVFIQSALPDIPLANSSVDTAVCMEVLYYLNEMALKSAIKELHRIIVPNGHLLVSTTIDKSGRYFTEKELCNVLKPYFQIKKVSYEYLRFYSKFLLLIKFAKKIFPNHSLVHKIAIHILYSYRLGIFFQSVERKLGKFSISNGVFLFTRKNISKSVLA